MQFGYNEHQSSQTVLSSEPPSWRLPHRPSLQPSLIVLALSVVMLVALMVVRVDSQTPPTFGQVFEAAVNPNLWDLITFKYPRASKNTIERTCWRKLGLTTPTTASERSDLKNCVEDIQKAQRVARNAWVLTDKRKHIAATFNLAKAHCKAYLDGWLIGGCRNDILRAVRRELNR